MCALVLCNLFAAQSSSTSLLTSIITATLPHYIYHLMALISAAPQAIALLCVM